MVRYYRRIMSDWEINKKLNSFFSLYFTLLYFTIWVKCMNFTLLGKIKIKCHPYRRGGSSVRSTPQSCEANFFNSDFRKNSNKPSTQVEIHAYTKCSMSTNFNNIWCNLRVNILRCLTSISMHLGLYLLLSAVIKTVKWFGFVLLLSKAMTVLPNF
jgi:hypothetical protein